MKNGKRILSVKVIREVDTDPDTSYLGEYSNRATSPYSIDRAHSEDCASVTYDGTRPDLPHAEDCTYRTGHAAPCDCDKDSEQPDCDCTQNGRWSSREYRYFNGCVENYKGESPEDIRKYVRQDYERMESLNSGQWCYIGIRAEAEVILDTKYGYQRAIQHITSGGLWGTESDSGELYLKSIEQEELSALRTELKALGFSARAISTAFKSIKDCER